MNITVQIQAPELVQAINNLAISLSGKTAPVMATAPADMAAVFAPPQTPVTPTQTPVTPSFAIPEQEPAVHPVAPAQPPVYTTPMAPPVTPAPPAPVPVPTTAQTYSLDQLAVAATQLVDAGRREELVGLLASFGVQALTALPKEQYGAFATQLRAMGAKI